MYDIKTILQESGLIKEISQLREENKMSLSLKYGKAILKNYTFLHIKEIWKDEHLFKYSYYWFTSDGRPIAGWDNSPHHNEIKTFPHHKHTAQGIVESFERDLRDVLDVIGKIL